MPRSPLLFRTSSLLARIRSRSARALARSRFVEQLARETVSLVMRQSASAAAVSDGLPDQCRPQVRGMHVANCPYWCGHWNAFNNLYVVRSEQREMQDHLAWYRASNAQVGKQRDMDLRRADFRQLVQRKRRDV